MTELNPKKILLSKMYDLNVKMEQCIELLDIHDHDEDLYDQIQVMIAKQKDMGLWINKALEVLDD